MGLEDTLKAAVGSAFKAVGDLKTAATYVAVTLDAYDPLTNIRATTEVVYTVNLIEVQIKESEVDWTPQDIETKKLLVSYSDLPIVSPNPIDYVTINSVKWEVIKVKRVPGDSVWQIFVRLP